MCATAAKLTKSSITLATRKNARCSRNSDTPIRTSIKCSGHLQSSFEARLAVGDYRGSFKAAKKSYDLACNELAESIRNDPDGCPLLCISFNKFQSLRMMAFAKVSAQADPQIALDYYKQAYSLVAKERPHLAYWATLCALETCGHAIIHKNLPDAQKYLLLAASNKEMLQQLSLRVDFWKYCIQHAALAAQGTPNSHTAPLAQAANFYAELKGNPGVVRAYPVVSLLAVLSHAMLLACGVRDYALCRKYGAIALDAADAAFEEKAPTKENGFGDVYICALFWYFQGCQVETAELKATSSVGRTSSGARSEEEEPWLTWLDERVGNNVAYRALTFYKAHKDSLDGESEGRIKLLGAQVMTMPVCFPPDVFDGIPEYFGGDEIQL